jgi:hypothetical protein
LSKSHDNFIANKKCITFYKITILNHLCKNINVIFIEMCMKEK